MGVAGVGVATGRALPGQPLYGVKCQVESWQLAATSGPADRGREQLSFARTRLAEVEALSRHQDLTALGMTDAGGSDAARITGTLRRMDAETRAGTADLASAARSGDVASGRELLSFADGQSARLTAVAPLLPAPAAPAVDTSRSVLNHVTSLARALPGVTTPDAVDPAPGSLSAPAESSSRQAVEPTRSSAPATRAPAKAGTDSSAAPPALPTDTAVPSPSPQLSAPPTSPPPGLPTSIRGLLSR